MRREFLGDSYDRVKRFLADSLEPVGRLFAHPRFIPSELQTAFAAMTRVPMLPAPAAMSPPFGVFLDPDTGVPLPTETVRGATMSHAPLPFIVDEIARLKPNYLVCFDQSFHRDASRTKQAQRELKRTFLTERGLASFYYVSHAPFLFVGRDEEASRAVRSRLVACGLPESRLEPNSKT